MCRRRRVTVGKKAPQKRCPHVEEEELWWIKTLVEKEKELKWKFSYVQEEEQDEQWKGMWPQCQTIRALSSSALST